MMRFLHAVELLVVVRARVVRGACVCLPLD